MEGAREGLKKALDLATIRDAEIPVYANVTAEPVTHAAEIRDLLYRQLTHPVRWEQSVRAMARDGAQAFLEVGPGQGSPRTDWADSSGDGKHQERAHGTMSCSEEGTMIAPDKSLRIHQYTFSGELFSKGFPEGGGPCRCSSAFVKEACTWISMNATSSWRIKGIIAREMDETQNNDPSSWFEEQVEDDPDFASGQRVGTQVINDKCAFLDKEGTLRYPAGGDKRRHAPVGIEALVLRPLPH